MKTKFFFNLQSSSDVITNSSSELFIFDDQDSKEKVIELLDKIYPEWRTEYDNPKYLSELEDDDVEEYMIRERVINYYENFDLMNSCKEFGISPYDADFLSVSTLAEMKKVFDKDKDSFALKTCNQLGIAPSEAFENWDIYDPFYKLDQTAGHPYMDYIERTQLNPSHAFIDAYRKANKNIIALFSWNENPNWEKQEILEQYAERIHLG